MKYTQDEIDVITQAVREYVDDTADEHTAWYKKHIPRMLDNFSVVEMCMYLDHESFGVDDWDDFHWFLKSLVKY